MIHLNFCIPSSKIKTYNENGIMTRGNAWIGDSYLDEAGIAVLLKTVRTHEDFLSILKKLNGCYSISMETDEYVFLASDKFGTYPLFYTMKDDDILIGDNVHDLAVRSGNTVINKDAEMDITYTGYIYKDETMLLGIYQVIASEYVIISKSDMKLTKLHHYRFTYEKENTIDSQIAFEMFDNICMDLAKRLVISLNGRRCILFLSGGVDSRFCAYLLKSAGYEDKTILLTYGTKLSPDYGAAVKTARFLGMKHIFVPYKRKDWAGTYTDEESLGYVKYAQNLTISAHLREHFVVRDLLKKGIISRDDVIVPGHLGTVAGRPYTSEQLSSVSTTHERLVDKTVLFYNMTKLKSVREYLFKRTRDLFPLTCSETDPMHYLSLYNNAAFSTYSIKYLINSLRAYDFYGLEWRLPLLDSEILSFFNRIEFDLIVSKKFFKSYVLEKIPLPFSKFSLNFIRKAFRNIFDARYACINLFSILKLKNECNSQIPSHVRAYRYIRNFSSYCSVYEIKMMEDEIDRIKSI